MSTKTDATMIASAIELYARVATCTNDEERENYVLVHMQCQYAQRSERDVREMMRRALADIASETAQRTSADTYDAACYASLDDAQQVEQSALTIVARKSEDDRDAEKVTSETAYMMTNDLLLRSLSFLDNLTARYDYDDATKRAYTRDFVRETAQTTYDSASLRIDERSVRAIADYALASFASSDIALVREKSARANIALTSALRSRAYAETAQTDSADEETRYAVYVYSENEEIQGDACCSDDISLSDACALALSRTKSDAHAHCVVDCARVNAQAMIDIENDRETDVRACIVAVFVK